MEKRKAECHLHKGQVVVKGKGIDNSTERGSMYVCMSENLYTARL